LGDLPDATANHGMFAHVHSEGAAYYAHAGSWVKLTNDSDLDAETTRATSAETVNNQAIAILQNQVSGISTSSGSTDIEMQANVDMATNKISNLGTPTSGTDAATKAYVDSGVAGVDLSGYTDTSGMTSAISTAKSEAISTASADATTKADQAETDAKAYADQVVAATVDAAPAALDTLNELAAALGDDANFASTVTTSLAAKADDVATTAALATKEDKTVVAALDTFVKGSSSTINVDNIDNGEMWFGNGSGSGHPGNQGGTVIVDASGMSPLRSGYTGSGMRLQPEKINFTEELTEPGEYTFTFTGPSSANGNIRIVAMAGWFSWNSATNSTWWTGSEFVEGYTVDSTYTHNDSNYASGSYTFTVPADGAVLALYHDAPNGSWLYLSDLSLVKTVAAPTLETTSTTIIEGINELHTELNTLSSTQSGDQSNLQSQITSETSARQAAIVTAKSEAVALAASDATTKADQAEADAKAYADQVVASTVDAAPAALDTLNELAAALGDDANFASTVTTSIATKADDAATTAALATKADDAATTAALATKANTSDLSSIQSQLSISGSSQQVIVRGQHHYNSNMGRVIVYSAVDNSIISTIDGTEAGRALGTQVLLTDDYILASTTKGVWDDDTTSSIHAYSTSDLTADPIIIGHPEGKGHREFGQAEGQLVVGNGKLFVSDNSRIYICDLSNLSAAPVPFEFETGSLNASAAILVFNPYDNYLYVGQKNAYGGDGAITRFDTNTMLTTGGSPETIYSVDAASISSMNFGRNIAIFEDCLYVSGKHAEGSPLQAVYKYNTSSFVSGHTAVPHLSKWSGSTQSLGSNDDFGSYIGSISASSKGTVIGAPNYGASDWNSGYVNTGRVYYIENYSNGTSSGLTPLNTSSMNLQNNEWAGENVHTDENYVYATFYGRSFSGANAVAVWSWDNISAAPTIIQTESGSGFNIGLLASSTTLSQLISDNTSAISAETTARTSAISTETSARQAAIVTAKSEAVALAASDATTKADAAQTAAISTASADATTKADQAEADAKAYADQVVASTVDAAPDALNTLNELAAALGDDANFASSVTSSIATKADDAATTAALATKADTSAMTTALATKADDTATTAALATKADVTTVTALDVSIKGSEPTPGPELMGDVTVSDLDGGQSSSTTHSSGGIQFARTGVEVAIFNFATEIGKEYEISYFGGMSPATGNNKFVVVPSGFVPTMSNYWANNILKDASGNKTELVVSGNSGTQSESGTFIAATTTVQIIFFNGSLDETHYIKSISVKELSLGVLDTTASHVIPAINELHTELNALSGTDTTLTSSITANADAITANSNAISAETTARTSAISAETTARESAVTSAISTASSDATTKADAAEADAIATASADATSKANAAQSAAVSTASSDATSKANAAQSAAESTASADATTKADAAQAAAAVDATTKSDAALVSAQTYADNAASTAVANVIDAAPASLDTLNELAAALGDDANFASTMTNSLATKANTVDVATAAQGVKADSALQPSDAVGLTVDNSDKLDGQQSSHFRIDIYDINGNIVN
jgi:hypothetical protein